MHRVASRSLRKLTTLKNRSDFLAVARAHRTGTRGFLVQALKRSPDAPVDAAQIRVGFTCSKKVGNAVARNRAKRRLRALAAGTLSHLAQPGWDYVLIGRAEHTAKRPFDKLERDLAHAIAKLHKLDP